MADDNISTLKIVIKDRKQVDVSGENLGVLTNGAIKRIDKQIHLAIKQARRAYRKEANQKAAREKREREAEIADSTEEKPKLKEQIPLAENEQEEADLEELGSNTNPGVTLESLGLTTPIDENK